MDGRSLIELYWDIMNTNRYRDLDEIVSANFRVEWPQSGERIRGLENYARMNEEYPVSGPWTFDVVRLLDGDSQVVTETLVSSPKVRATVIGFFEIVDGKIDRIVEFWPDPFEPMAERSHLVEMMPPA